MRQDYLSTDRLLPISSRNEVVERPMQKVGSISLSEWPVMSAFDLDPGLLARM